MGCGASSDAGAAPGPTLEQVREDEKILTNLEEQQRKDELKIKLLLLGAGESGKSTIFKQMRIIYGTPRTDEELRMFGVVIRSNCITVTRKLCQLIQMLELEDVLEEEEKAEGADMSPFEAYELLVSHLIDGTAPALEPIDLSNDWVGHLATAGLGPNNDAQMFLQIWKPIKILWESNLMKEVWQKRSHVNIIDGHKDFLDSLDRIASSSFKPTQQDVLLARVKTTQVNMERYRIDSIDFEMYDVGGQRSERRKWIDCFDSVDAVIFVAALSEYDQNLAESKRTNRMVEALELFRSICNNRAFSNTSVMLFLNKKDIFEEKLQYSDIAAQRPFADYAGPPNDFNNGVIYFIEKFKDCLINDEITDSFIQACTATDTNNMEFVLDSTRTIIMTDNLRRSGFLGAG
jgi:guanine nucleotide-binding protein G(o) subunit alpha